MHRVKQACILSVASSSHPFCEIIYFGPFYTCQVKGLCHGQVHWFFESLEIASIASISSHFSSKATENLKWKAINTISSCLLANIYVIFYYTSSTSKKAPSLFLLAYFAKIKLLLMMGGFRSWTKARLATKKRSFCTLCQLAFCLKFSGHLMKIKLAAAQFFLWSLQFAPNLLIALDVSSHGRLHFWIGSLWEGDCIT